MRFVILLSMFVLLPLSGQAEQKNFDWLDVFELEYAGDPQFTVDGEASFMCAHSWIS